MRRYFKGYYFKCSLGDEAIAFIPALHFYNWRGKGEQSDASLQIITKEHTYYIPYETGSFGGSHFSKKGIYLDVDSEACSIHGKLKFGRFQKIKYDIMGPFCYVPFMQCRHRVLSMQHKVSGKIVLNGKTYCDKNGLGYLEGDSGYSFPAKYLWTQCHFKNGSLMLSVAEIPLCGFHFTGIIGIVLLDGKEYRIATYLGARVSSLKNRTVVVKQGKYTFLARLLEEASGELKAPACGKMSRTIRESLCCKARYCFVKKDRVLLDFTSENASFEDMYI